MSKSSTQRHDDSPATAEVYALHPEVGQQNRARFGRALAKALSKEHCLVRVQTASGTGEIRVMDGQIAWVEAAPAPSNLVEHLVNVAQLPPDAVAAAVKEVSQAGGDMQKLVAALPAADATIRKAFASHFNQHLTTLQGWLTTGFKATAHPCKQSYSAPFLFASEELSLSPSAASSTASTTGHRPSEPALRVVAESSEEHRSIALTDINTFLSQTMEIEGAVAAAIVDWESGLTLGTAVADNSFDVELAASGNTRVVQAKMAVMRDLNIGGSIEDILITLDEQYHVIRPVRAFDSLFVYFAIDRKKGNLGLARRKLSILEGALQV